GPASSHWCSAVGSAAMHSDAAPLLDLCPTRGLDACHSTSAPRSVSPQTHLALRRVAAAHPDMHEAAMSALDRRHSAPPSRLEYSTSPPGSGLDPDPIYLTKGIARASPLPSRLALGAWGSAPTRQHRTKVQSIATPGREKSQECAGRVRSGSGPGRSRPPGKEMERCGGKRSGQSGWERGSARHPI